MLSFVLFLIIICLVLGILGVIVHGLIWLTVAAVVLFLVTLVFGGSRIGARRRR